MEIHYSIYIFIDLFIIYILIILDQYIDVTFKIANPHIQLQVLQELLYVKSGRVHYYTVEPVDLKLPPVDTRDTRDSSGYQRD